MRSNGEQLAEPARLADAGRLRIGIGSVFFLSEAARAHDRAGRGHLQGKTVLQVGAPWASRSPVTSARPPQPLRAGAGGQPRTCSPNPVRPAGSSPSFRCSEGIS
ncbi:zinc-binding dehydrogenase [Streptomyces sp. NBC_01233]|uniref:zinc-binding dehydrogenase n=1 Tax=Streptomyces sp. NBC_01233 TaxID=2903787 RepID=UPI002E12AA45